MKKYGLRVLVGLIAFVIGLIGFWFLVTERKFHIQFHDNVTLDSETQIVKHSTNPNGKVEIRFVGYGKSENRPTLKFEIINHNSSPAKYWSFSEKAVWTFVKFKGKQREEWRCGTGSREFILNSGESFEIEVLADLQTYEFLKKDGFFEFGYYFKTDAKDAKMFWSEPIKLSDELREEIIKNAPAFLKHKD